MAVGQASASPTLRFELAGENYAFDVLRAREVLTLVKITPLPSALPILSGVINPRGAVVDAVRGVTHSDDRWCLHRNPHHRPRLLRR